MSSADHNNDAVTVIGAEIGLLTPPLGISCFVIKASLNDPEVSLKDVFLAPSLLGSLCYLY